MVQDGLKILAQKFMEQQVYLSQRVSITLIKQIKLKMKLKIYINHVMR